MAPFQVHGVQKKKASKNQKKNKVEKKLKF